MKKTIAALSVHIVVVIVLICCVGLYQLES